MPPVLSLTSGASQIAGHNSPTFNMANYISHNLHPNPPSLVPLVKTLRRFKISSSAEISRLTCLHEIELDNLLNLIVDCSNMPNTEEHGDSGEYLSSKRWELIEIKKKSDARGRFHVTDKFVNRHIRVFVSDSDQPIQMCEDKFLLPFPLYEEVVQSRYKSTAGNPLNVQNSGDVWMGSANKDKYIKCFVKKVTET